MKVETQKEKLRTLLLALIDGKELYMIAHDGPERTYMELGYYGDGISHLTVTGWGSRLCNNWYEYLFTFPEKWEITKQNA